MSAVVSRALGAVAQYPDYYLLSKATLDRFRTLANDADSTLDDLTSFDRLQLRWAIAGLPVKAGTYEEEKHPRDAQGKWAEKPDDLSDVPWYMRNDPMQVRAYREAMAGNRLEEEREQRELERNLWAARETGVLPFNSLRGTISRTSQGMHDEFDVVSKLLGEKWDATPEEMNAIFAEEYKNQPPGRAITADTVATAREHYAHLLIRAWTGSSGDVRTIPVIAGALDAAGVDYDWSTFASMRWMEKHPLIEQPLRRLGKLMYEETQQWFKERGIKEVQVARKGGWSLDRPFSSWALAAADVYHEGGGDYVYAQVPVERVISIPATGFGNRLESEFVLMPRDEAVTFEYDEKRTKSIKFAWDESKHPRHAAGTSEGGQFAPKDLGVIAGEFNKVPPEMRVWQGKSHPMPEQKPFKLATGAFGERVASQVLSAIKQAPFGSLNVEANNIAIDVIGDHWAVEVKTGLATNGLKAQQWRATIGEPGETEKALIKQMSPEEKRRANQFKEAKILERKREKLKNLSEMAGGRVEGKTVCLIVAPDLKAADVFIVDGFHLRLGWNKFATDEYYLGTFRAA